MSASKKYILTKEEAAKKLRRMAFEIAECNYAGQELLLIGIKENGFAVAEQLAHVLKTTCNGPVSLYALHINKKQPAEIILQPPVDCNNKLVILADDVANSGKTMLYAMQPLLKSYPARIQTLALVERTHKSFPVQIDYKGISVSTHRDEHICVEVEMGEIMGAWVEEAS